jgi:hypothetical protein
MRSLLWLWPALALLLPAVGPPVEVSEAQGRLTIRANGAPLSDVLAELARKAGIEVVYEAAPPRHPVTVNITGLPTEEAIAKLMERVPLSWGLKRNPSGRVGTLVIAGDPSRRPPTPTPRATPSPARPRTPGAASYPSQPETASYPRVRP